MGWCDPWSGYVSHTQLNTSRLTLTDMLRDYSEERLSQSKTETQQSKHPICQLQMQHVVLTMESSGLQQTQTARLLQHCCL